ncbi:ComF family protein [Luteibacter sp. dw_328]|uniref:ComF family protein n=1 Tax=Luteibacter sp. dw_328 TaxID=2719796 RepID=UPI001BD4E496|nr:ComF family protein [Luteibacter sp. dw_328]
MDASRFTRWIAAAGRFVLPPRCLVCGDQGNEARELCRACYAALPRNLACCGRCALPLPTPIAECDACRMASRPWADLWVPYEYGWPLDSLETRFKFAGSLAAGRVLADAWMDAGPPPSVPELLLPVPLHLSRLRSRGYNQALELARPMGRRYRVPVNHDVLYRARRTDAQSELDAAARLGNVRGAFAVRRVPVQKHVAIVDDVMTTGATLIECTKALLAVGIERVDVWALARTPLPGGRQ